MPNRRHSWFLVSAAVLLYWAAPAVVADGAEVPESNPPWPYSTWNIGGSEAMGVDNMYYNVLMDALYCGTGGNYPAAYSYQPNIPRAEWDCRRIKVSKVARFRGETANTGFPLALGHTRQRFPFTPRSKSTCVELWVLSRSAMPFPS